MTGRPQTCISAGFLACIAGAMFALLFVAAQGAGAQGPAEPAATRETAGARAEVSGLGVSHPRAEPYRVVMTWQQHTRGWVEVWKSSPAYGAAGTHIPLAFSGTLEPGVHSWVFPSRVGPNDHSTFHRPGDRYYLDLHTEDGRVLTFGPVEPAPLGVFDRSPYNLALPIIGR